MRRSALYALLILSAATMATTSAHAQQTPNRLSQFLHASIGLDDKQLAAMERGEIVVKALDTRDKRDVALFGVVTTSVVHEVYERRLRDFQSWLPRPSRARYGIFSDPPTLQDTRTLTLDPRGLEELKDCRPRACDVKLPAVEMQTARCWRCGSTERHHPVSPPAVGGVCSGVSRAWRLEPDGVRG